MNGVYLKIRVGSSVGYHDSKIYKKRIFFLIGVISYIIMTVHPGGKSDVPKFMYSATRVWNLYRSFGPVNLSPGDSFAVPGWGVIPYHKFIKSAFFCSSGDFVYNYDRPGDRTDFPKFIYSKTRVWKLSRYFGPGNFSPGDSFAIPGEGVILYQTCSSPRRTFFLHALSFECTSNCAVLFSTKFYIIFILKKCITQFSHWIVSCVNVFSKIFYSYVLTSRTVL